MNHSTRTLINIDNKPITVTLETLYKLRVKDNKNIAQVVYVYFRESMQYTIADVQVGNNCKTFEFYSDIPFLVQYNNHIKAAARCNGVYMKDILAVLANKLLTSK